MSNAEMTDFQTFEDTPFVQFWNEVLAPKFIRLKHTQRSCRSTPAEWW